ncbi:MAG: hypothetical protein MZU84_07305 [Sphingobacterium sp.]|nr:hypothetical protein [Sphingobacterium sp.]
MPFDRSSRALAGDLPWDSRQVRLRQRTSSRSIRKFVRRHDPVRTTTKPTPRSSSPGLRPIRASEAPWTSFFCIAALLPIL